MTKERVTAALGLLETMLELIAAHGAQGVPSGHLYAEVMSVMSLENYEHAIALLISVGCIRREGHVLIAIP
jgi:hypothetical protein